jgi:hypothetical protein
MKFVGLKIFVLRDKKQSAILQMWALRVIGNAFLPRRGLEDTNLFLK